MSRLFIWPSMMLLGWTETKLWILKYGSKSIQTSLLLRQRPPKLNKLLKFFISFVTTVKSRHAPTIWKKPRWKSLCFPILKSITEKILYDFGGRCLKITVVCMDFKPYCKVHSLVSVHPKSIILVQMTNLDMTFHVVVSVYRFVKIWNSPQFTAERNGQYIRDFPRGDCTKNMSEEKTTTRQGLVCAKTRAGQKTPKIFVSR